MDATQTAPPDAPKHDLRLVPVAVAAWIGAWVGTSGLTWAVATAAVLAGLLGVVATGRRSARLGSVAAVVAAALLLGCWQQYRLSSGPVAALADAEAVATVNLVIRTDPDLGFSATAPGRTEGSGADYVTLRATLTGVEGRGQAWRSRAPVLVVASGAALEAWRSLKVGQTVRCSARLQAPDLGSDLAAVLRVRSPEMVTGPPLSGLRLVERVRQGLRDAVVARRPEPRALVPALVLGDTSAITPELEADFQTTGLTHLTAVSGANLTLLLAFLLLAARWLGVRAWWLRLVGLLGVVIFIALCRTEPSVLRASAMGLVALAALGTGGGRAPPVPGAGGPRLGGIRRGLRHLCVAALLLLLFDPFLGRSVGFALSVLASGGIVWWGTAWADVLSRWLPRFLAETVAVPLSAHLSTMPVVAGIAGTVSIAGLLCNAVAGPFVGPATVLGFAAAGVSLISPGLAGLAGFGAAWSAQAILWVAHAGAALPGASSGWPTSAPALALLVILSLLAGRLLPRVLRRRWLTLVLALLMGVLLAVGPRQPGWPPRAWVLVACDVGQGDALVVRVAAQQAMVVDAGPDPERLDQCLDRLGIRSVPLLVLTHFHADHVDGLAAVLRDRPVGQVWVSPYASPALEAAEVAALTADRGVPLSVPEPGMAGTLGQLTWSVLGPRPAAGSAAVEAEGESAAENDASLVLMVTVQGVRVLLTGDVEPAGQRAILAAGADLRADVLKLPHHGSARQEAAFFAATGARVAVASAGADNTYGHPAPRTIRMAESLGMTVLRTDTQGSVAVVLTGRGLAAAVERR